MSRFRRVSVLGLALVLVLSLTSALSFAESAPDQQTPQDPAANAQASENKGKRPGASEAKVNPAIRKIQLILQQGGVKRGAWAAHSALTNTDPSVRKFAVEVLSKYGVQNHLAGVIKLQQADPAADVRMAAEMAQYQIKVRATGDNLDKQATILGHALKSEQKNVRYWAARTLAGNPTQVARDAVAEARKAEKDPDVLAELNRQ